jgi:hypothetical protein
MDWQRIWTVLDVFLKAQNVPNTELIRKRAMEELAAWNTDGFMEAPESTEEPELEFGARRL